MGTQFIYIYICIVHFKKIKTFTLIVWVERTVEFSAKEKEIIVLQDGLVSAYEGFSFTANKQQVLWYKLLRLQIYRKI